MARVGWQLRSSGGCGAGERYIVRCERRAGVVMPMHLADVRYVVMLNASLETLLPLDILENFKIHA
jgi:hypothetical protein